MWYFSLLDLIQQKWKKIKKPLVKNLLRIGMLFLQKGGLSMGTRVGFTNLKFYFKLFLHEVTLVLHNQLCLNFVHKFSYISSTLEWIKLISDRKNSRQKFYAIFLLKFLVRIRFSPFFILFSIPKWSDEKRKSWKVFADINIDFHFSQSSLEFHPNFNIHSHFNFQFEMLKCLMKGKWIFRVFSLLYPPEDFFLRRDFLLLFSTTILTRVTYEVEEKTIMFQFPF